MGKLCGSYISPPVVFVCEIRRIQEPAPLISHPKNQ